MDYPRPLVLADFHHGDLFESLRILVEDRLGGILYRQVGLDWYHEDCWKVFDHIDTAKQYLEVHEHSEPRDVHGNLVTEVHGRNAWLNKDRRDNGDGTFEIHDHNHGGRIHHGVLMDRAKGMPWDFIISSMPDHFHRFESFRSTFCPSAKHIYQLGNIGWTVPHGVLNLMNSTDNPIQGNIPNVVHYHQEFDLEEFCYQDPLNTKCVTNLMHWMEHQGYPRVFRDVSDILRAKDWSIRAYGAGNADGPTDHPSDAIKIAGFVWHCKLSGDGYGHNIFNSFACGRPMVVNMDRYRGTRAGRMFIDGKTVIDITGKTPLQIATQLEEAAENWKEWSDNVTEVFQSQVNFDIEEEQIRKFLSSCV